MNKNKLKNDLVSIGRDILIAFVIVSIVMLGLFAYSGIWPPMVVIESGSMEHPPGAGVHRSYVGVIDTGDMVFVKDVDGRDDLVTYVQGEAADRSNYGSYGDVVVYRPNGLKYRNDGTDVVPIIHRLVVWLEINTTHVSDSPGFIDYANYSFDVPSLNLHDTLEPVILTNYGYESDTVVINLDEIMIYYQSNGLEPHGGFITMGDNNAPSYDQPYSGGYEPVLPEWIIGKAWGEMPWFGLIKLWFTGSNLNGVPSNSWTGLFTTIAVIVLAPMILDFVIPRLNRRKENEGGEITGTEETWQPEDTGPGHGPAPGGKSIEEEVPPEVVAATDGNTDDGKPPPETDMKTNGQETAEP